MPRHNLYKIAPYVKSLCEKHGVPYVVKGLGEAFADIVRWEHTLVNFFLGFHGHVCAI